MSTQVVLENVIISYPNLFEPKCAKGSDVPRYSASLILPEGFDTTEIKAAMAAVKKEKWGDNQPKNLKSQLSKVDGGPYDDFWQISANSSEKYPPQVVDANVNPILDKNAIFAGCIVNAQVACFGYDIGSNGVGVGLNMVQLVSNVNVERLDNAQDAKDVFKKIKGAPQTATKAGTPEGNSGTAALVVACGAIDESDEDNSGTIDESAEEDDIDF